MRIQNISVRNFLSFGPDSETISLENLNIIVGINGSGKSNFIEVLNFLRSSTKDRPITSSSGSQTADFFWKGRNGSHLNATITSDILIDKESNHGLQQTITVDYEESRLRIASEDIISRISGTEKSIYRSNRAHNRATFFVEGGAETSISDRDFSWERSVLAQNYIERFGGEARIIKGFFGSTRIYREWNTGKSSPIRTPQPADALSDFLEEDGSNLGLILNSIKDDSNAKSAFIENIQELYPNVIDFDIKIIGGAVQVVLEEKVYGRIPATRLSDGTLRYLCLLGVLLHPNPPSLICLEEPELGVHPDVISNLAHALKNASTRTQVIVTTHSDLLLDALTDTPEAVMVCERNENGTHIRRVDPGVVASYLNEDGEYLGQLWRRGVLGGNRW